MKVTLAPSWIAACWKAIPIGCLEGMLIARLRRGRVQGFIYVRAEYPLAIKRLKIAIRQAERLGIPGQQHLWYAVQLPNRFTPRRGGLRVRRGDGVDCVSRGKAWARPGPALPIQRRKGCLAKPTLINNVETYANIAAHHPEWRSLVRENRNRKKQRDEGVRARGPHCQHWARGSADGHHTPRDYLRHRRRNSGRKASTKPYRRAGRPAAACRRNSSTCLSTMRTVQSRLHHGVRRHDRHGRIPAWWMLRKYLHGILHERVVRQMCSMQGRHLSNEPNSGSHHAARSLSP